MGEENPRELFLAKPGTVRLKPNPLSAPGGIWTRVLEVEGEVRYHFANRATLVQI